MLIPPPALSGVGVLSCEMTTIANTLRMACKYRALGKEQKRRLPAKRKVSGGPAEAVD